MVSHSKSRNPQGFTGAKMQIGDIVERANGRAGRRRPLQLVVIEFEGAWRILLNGEKVGRFSRREDAVECALEIAQEARGEGHAVELLSQDVFGEIHTFTGRA